MLFEMFRSQIGELFLRLDKVDGDLSFLPPYSPSGQW